MDDGRPPRHRCGHAGGGDANSSGGRTPHSRVRSAYIAPYSNGAAFAQPRGRVVKWSSGQVVKWSSGQVVRHCDIATLRCCEVRVLRRRDVHFYNSGLRLLALSRVHPRWTFIPAPNSAWAPSTHALTRFLMQLFLPWWPSLLASTCTVTPSGAFDISFLFRFGRRFRLRVHLSAFVDAWLPCAALSAWWPTVLICMCTFALPGAFNIPVSSSLAFVFLSAFTFRFSVRPCVVAFSCFCFGAWCCYVRHVPPSDPTYDDNPKPPPFPSYS